MREESTRPRGSWGAGPPVKSASAAIASWNSVESRENLNKSFFRLQKLFVTKKILQNMLFFVVFALLLLLLLLVIVLALFLMSFSFHFSVFSFQNKKFLKNDNTEAIEIHEIDVDEDDFSDRLVEEEGKMYS